MRLIWIGGIILALVGIGAGLWEWREPIADQFQNVQASLGSKSTIRFVVVGDTHGDNPVYRQILEEVRGGEYQFMLNLADTSEDGTAQEFQAVVALEQSLPFPVYHTVGNHDIKTDSSRELFSSSFGQPAWGSFQQGSIRIILLDNADRKVGFSADQLDWLELELQKQHDGPTVLAYHRPFDLPFASLFGDDETTASAITNERLVSLLNTNPVDHIFSAHVHTYISYSLANIPAVVSGGGGDPAQTILGGPKNNNFHYLIVTVTGNDLAIDVRQVQLTE